MEKIIQITSGYGPPECEMAVAKVLKIMILEFAANHIAYEILHKVDGDINTAVKSATLLLSGNDLTQFLNNWLGTICWIEKSTIRKFHKRSNWYIGIFELNNNKAFTFSEKDIRYQAVRSQGSGGQNVNRVSTAIRATYVPMNCSVFVQDTRSQLENKKIALLRLKEKVYQSHMDLLTKEMQTNWLKQIDVQRGNPTRTFEGAQFKKSFIDKGYKKERLALKNDLKNYLK